MVGRSGSLSKTDIQVANELVEKWSSPDHDCPFGKMTQDKLCKKYEDCRVCIHENALTNIRRRKQ